ncbi:MAG: AAA family ATPase [Myxococcales bacterium]|jgi:DNA transposition AAA+ family ATPase|nr:AAA family ATPase [Myxococcales bacterium]
MRNIIAETRNLTTLAQTAEALRTRATDLPGIAAIVGKPGSGKTQGCVWLRDQVDAIYMKANSFWTPRSMLDCLCVETGVDTRGLRGVVIDRLIERLAISYRAIIIDEGDYLVEKISLLDALRDIHDLSGAPLLVVGMQDFLAKVKRREQFASRIARTIQFGDATIEDVRVVAKACCEVELADDLLARIVSSCAASMRRIKVSLAQVEGWALRKDLECVDSSTWGSQVFDGAVEPSVAGSKKSKTGKAVRHE